MKTLILIFSLFGLAQSAQAHLEVGTYAGVMASGQPCGMQVLSSWFEKNQPHPLNERVKLTVNNEEFIVGHPPVIDAPKNSAFFNHDLFQAVNATPTGARALLIEMVHTQQFEGPRAFQVIDHNWKTNLKQSFRCENLQFKKSFR